MPELPEVQTTVDGLNKTVKSLVIKGVWSDISKHKVSRPDHIDTIKHLPFFQKFESLVLGQKIVNAERRAKNILIHLKNGYTILIHMKMTGHILYGAYMHDTQTNTWSVSPQEKNSALRDPHNRFVHFVFILNNQKQLVFCDSRKFGKITIIKTTELATSKHTRNLGPEILEKNFDVKKFTMQLIKKRNGKIKTILMDQTLLSGIGNIYPDSTVSKLPQKDLKNLFVAIKEVLTKGIDFGGDSMSDYRRIDGTRGEFQNNHNAYRLIHQTCKKPRCFGVIIKKVIGGRSAHFCNKHQKLFI